MMTIDELKARNDLVGQRLAEKKREMDRLSVRIDQISVELEADVAELARICAELDRVQA